jgi:hypothetical protein
MEGNVLMDWVKVTAIVRLVTTATNASTIISSLRRIAITLLVKMVVFAAVDWIHTPACVPLALQGSTASHQLHPIMADVSIIHVIMAQHVLRPIQDTHVHVPLDSQVPIVGSLSITVSWNIVVMEELVSEASMVRSTAYALLVIVDLTALKYCHSAIHLLV